MRVAHQNIGGGRPLGNAPGRAARKARRDGSSQRALNALLAASPDVACINEMGNTIVPAGWTRYGSHGATIYRDTLTVLARSTEPLSDAVANKRNAKSWGHKRDAYVVTFGGHERPVTVITGHLCPPRDRARDLLGQSKKANLAGQRALVALIDDFKDQGHVVVCGVDTNVGWSKATQPLRGCLNWHVDPVKRIDWLGSSPRATSHKPLPKNGSDHPGALIDVPTTPATTPPKPPKEPTMMLTDLADACRKSGLKVVEVDGWERRGHGGMSGVRTIVCHHTAGPASGNMPSLNVVMAGRAGLSGPLSQLGLGRDGTVYVIAAGLAYHAGVVGQTSWGNSYAIGIEAEATGTGTWPKVQYDAYARLCAALVKHYGLKVTDVRGHKEVAVPRGRKIDPNFSMDAFREQVAKLDAKPAAPASKSPRWDALIDLAKDIRSDLPKDAPARRDVLDDLIAAGSRFSDKHNKK